MSTDNNPMIEQYADWIGKLEKEVMTLRAQLAAKEQRGITYETLEPGLLAAIELLQRELANERSAGEAADAQDQHVAAQTHAVCAMSCKYAIELLQEQTKRLKGGIGADRS